MVNAGSWYFYRLSHRVDPGNPCECTHYYVLYHIAVEDLALP